MRRVDATGARALRAPSRSRLAAHHGLRPGERGPCAQEASGGVRAYHRIDPLMDERKSHYTPAQFGAYLKVQLAAGRQSHRGRFRSLDALRGALPTAYARHVQFLVDEGDIVVSKTHVYVDGWDEWQEGDVTVKERMARLRNRKRNGGVTSDGPRV